jgi:hypothetical protein
MVANKKRIRSSVGTSEMDDVSICAKVSEEDDEEDKMKHGKKKKNFDRPIAFLQEVENYTRVIVEEQKTGMQLKQEYDRLQVLIEDLKGNVSTIRKSLEYKCEQIKIKKSMEELDSEQKAESFGFHLTPLVLQYQQDVQQLTDKFCRVAPLSSSSSSLEKGKGGDEDKKKWTWHEEDQCLQEDQMSNSQDKELLKKLEDKIEQWRLRKMEIQDQKKDNSKYSSNNIKKKKENWYKKTKLEQKNQARKEAQQEQDENNNGSPNSDGDSDGDGKSDSDGDVKSDSGDELLDGDSDDDFLFPEEQKELSDSYEQYKMEKKKRTKGYFYTLEEEERDRQQCLEEEKKSIDERYVRLLQRRMDPDKVLPEFIQRDVCRHCRSDMIKNKSESQLICTNPQCGKSYLFLNSTSDALAYGEEVEIPKHVYERNKHFKGFVTQFHESQSTIPNFVLAALKYRYFEKIHHRSKKKIKPTPVRKGLKVLGLQNWYNKSTIISHRLNGVPIPTFNEFQYNRILVRFEMMQLLFDQLRSNRTNFMNFNFSIQQFMKMDGLDYFVDSFPLLKTKPLNEHLYQIMTVICEILQSRRKHESDLHWILPRRF